MCFAILHDTFISDRGLGIFREGGWVGISSAIYRGKGGGGSEINNLRSKGGGHIFLSIWGRIQNSDFIRNCHSFI